MIAPFLVGKKLHDSGHTEDNFDELLGHNILCPHMQVTDQIGQVAG